MRYLGNARRGSLSARFDCSARKRIRRGYTTVELATAAVLGALLIAVVLGWAGGVAKVVTTSVRAGDGGETALLVGRMGDDLLQAGHCDPAGRDSVLRTLSPDRIQIVSMSSGTPMLVSYRISAGVVERGSAEMAANCDTPEVTNWVPVARGFDSTTVFLAPVRDGVVSEDVLDYPSCTDVFAAGCDMSAVRVQLLRTETKESRVATLSIGRI